jgi:tetratricopeptide (TPR) repeat protein
VYEPVALPGEGEGTAIPDQSSISKVYTEVFSEFIEKEIEPRVATLKEKIQESNSNPKYHNSLAVLYARYGQKDNALAELEGILEERGNYLPALMNIGNIYFLDSLYEKALDYYFIAEEAAPENAKVVLAFARTQHALEDYESAKIAYGKLKALDPDLAGRYAYLDTGAESTNRAADMEMTKGNVLWEEE